MAEKKAAASSEQDIDWDELAKEFSYSTSRSGGSGGQHVNKVETKVTVKFNIASSSILTEDNKTVLQSALKHRLSKSSELSMYCQATRSQLTNKERVTANLIRLIKKSLVVRKKRKRTKISKEKKAKILEDKRKRSAIKKSRQKPRLY